MPKLPRTPNVDRLKLPDPSVRQLTGNPLWHRIYRRGGEHSTRWNALRYFGPTDARFDHQLLGEAGRPHQQDRGIIYLASDIPTCLAEVFQANREVDRRDRHPWLASFRLQSTLALLDLTDTFPVQAGGSMKLVSGARRYAGIQATRFWFRVRLGNAKPRLQAVAHAANAVLHMASLPLQANIQFMTVMASKMPFIGRG